MHIQQLESKKEVQSLPGLISTFNKWVPELSLKDKRIRDMGKKKVIFKWTVDRQKCFKEVKRAISDNIPMEPFDPAANSIVLWTQKKQGWICVHSDFHRQKGKHILMWFHRADGRLDQV